MVKKKYPKITPRFMKNKNGKNVKVILQYDVYNSIFEEINDLKKRLSTLKKQKQKSTKSK